LAYSPTFQNASSRPGRAKVRQGRTLAYLSARRLRHCRAPQVFGNTLAEVDWSIGAILDSLESTGLRNTTLVVLTSDNG
jgi:arylsulfatase A-like enzyme